MPFSTARTVALQGALGYQIDVQADVSGGQAGLTMVGRLDTSLREAGDRCQMAVRNSNLEWPATKRITVLLSPADLAKTGTHYDLAIAVAVLGAQGRLPASQLLDTGFIGELTLAGGLRPVAGVLPMVMALAERGVRRVFVPEPQAHEAAMVPGMAVLGLRSLEQVVAELTGEHVPDAPPVAAMSGTRLLSWRGQERLEEVDLADLSGMADAKFAVEVASGGGHAVLLTGPKGSGKTSLAERVPTILPDLRPEEALELAALHSLAGALQPGDGLLVRLPFSAPHHDASKASIVGGGSGRIRPGELSRAHAGVLFMDEFPLFRSDIIEALRQPLESGEITIARTDESVTLPARGMLVLAANPCPCGEYTSDARTNSCRCPSQRLRTYQDRLTGPVADRIDVVRHVPALRRGELDRLRPPETSAVVRDRVAAVRSRQHERFADCDWRLNSQLPGPLIRDHWPVEAPAQRLVDDALYGGRLSSRGAVRVLRLAWTLADVAAVRAAIDGPRRPGVDDVLTALALRLGDPLQLSVTERRAG